MPFKKSEVYQMSPLGVLICDSEQRVLSVNDRFLTDTGLVESDIVGNLYESLPLEAIDKHAHIVQLFDASNNAKKFSYWQAELPGNEGTTAHYFTLERDKVTNHPYVDGSNLPKRANWVEFLDYEVSRSRRYDNPLSLLKLHIIIYDNPENIDDKIIGQAVKDTLMDELRWADMIGNTNQGSYLMVLPETPESALSHLKQKILTAITSQMKFLSSDIKSDVVFGSANWRKHDDSHKMLKKARENLVEALEAMSEKPVD